MGGEQTSGAAEPVGSALLAAWDAAAGGSGRLILLAGEAGIGKTTAARELAATARARGATVRWSACWAEGGTIAHAPWRWAIRSTPGTCRSGGRSR